jgi:hypothetical protein
MPPQDRADRDGKAARSASAIAARNRDAIGDYDQPFHFALRRHLAWTRAATRSKEHAQASDIITEVRGLFAARAKSEGAACGGDRLRHFTFQQ